MVIRHFYRPILLSLLSIILALATDSEAIAQIRFEVDAPKTVALDERFQITFILHNALEGSFSAPSFDGLNVLFPPGSAISRQNINGKKRATFTGTFMAQKEGDVRIGEATIKVNGKVYKSQPFTIKVLPADNKNGTGDKAKTTPKGLATNDVFIRVIPAYTIVYEQQALLVTFKLYTRTGRMDFEEVKFPQFDGFIEQELPISMPIQLEMEHFKGRNYYTAILKQSILFPQRAGRLTVPKGKFGIRVEVAQEISDWESLFNFTTPALVRKTITSPELIIEAKPLPEPKPESFTNAVGDFSLKFEIDKGAVLKSNEVISFRLSIQGTGNLKLLSPPQVVFPESFESYEPVIEEDIRATPQGESGQKDFVYNVIPRNRGEFTIPAVRFSFFDVARERYITKETEPITLAIAQGEGDYVSNRREVALQGNDIAYLLPYQGSSSARSVYFWASPRRFLPFVLIALIAFVGALLYLYQAKRRSDLVGVKRKAASRRIRKHFQQLNPLVEDGKDELFYEALPKVLYSYLADRYAIPTHQLQASAIRLRLSEQGIASEVIEQLEALLAQVDEAAFSSNSAKTSPSKLLEESIALVEILDKKSYK